MYQRIIRDPGGRNSVRIIYNERIVNGSRLIVPPDTVALFTCNGSVSEPYGPGAYDINTGESPFFTQLRNLMTAGDMGLQCQVWYVNTKVENCKTGGTGELIFNEKRFNISLKGKASYTVRYTIQQPYRFISKLIGMHNRQYSDDDIMLAIDSMLLPYIKHYLISYISSHTVYGLQDDLVGIGNQIYPGLSEALAYYGIGLKKIAITSINIPKEEFKRLTDLENKLAEGKLNTRIEKDNIDTIYGDLDKRTIVELLTGTSRSTNETVNNNAGGANDSLARLPIQMAIAQKIVRNMPDDIFGLFDNSEQVFSSNSSNRRNQPPDLPGAMVTCQNCGRRNNRNNNYCSNCGRRID